MNRVEGSGLLRVELELGVPLFTLNTKVIDESHCTESIDVADMTDMTDITDMTDLADEADEADMTE